MGFASLRFDQRHQSFATLPLTHDIAVARVLTFLGAGALPLIGHKAGHSSPGMRAAMLSDSLIYTGRLRVGTGVALVSAASYLAARLGEMSLPFLVQHGTEDAFVSMKGSVELFERASSGDKQMRTYPGAGHNLLHEAPATLAAVRSDYLSWLDSHADEVSRRRELSLASAQL